MLREQRNNSRSMRPITCKYAMILVIFGPFSAYAQDGAVNSGQDDWGFSFGAFFADQDMKTEFEVSFGDAGMIIDFEDDLGLKDSQSVFRLGAYNNLNERHRIEFDIFDLSQSATAILSRDIEWGDTVFPISAEVATGLDLSIYKVAYTYNMLRREKFKLGVTGGLYIADIAIELQLLDFDDQESGDVTAPLPVLGIRGEYYFSERWRATASAEWFGLEIDDYDGTLQDVLIGIDYRVTKHASIGVGFNDVDIDVDATEKAIRADLKWEYSGYIAYLRFSF